MRWPTCLALILCTVAAGCGGGDSDDRAETGPDPAPDTAPAPAPERPLADAWYEDPDGDFMPTAIEEELGTAPEVNECLEALDCPGVSETGTAEPPKDRNTLLMLDSSGSMRGPAGGGETKLDAAKDALGRFVAGTPSDFNLGFLVFGHKGSNRQEDKAASCRAPELLDPIGEVDFRSLPRTLRSFEPTGFTPIARSLAQAERAFDGASDADNRIILVTDGVETCGGNPVAQARALKQAGIAVTVDVVGFDIGKAGDREKLRRIAEATGGTYTDAQTGDQLKRYFDGLRDRASRLLDASICIATKSTDTRVCSEIAVTDASIAMRRLAGDASQAGDDAEADELLRLRDEMKDAQERFDDESTEQSEETLDRLRRERRQLEERIRDAAALPADAGFAAGGRLCPASPFVRRRLLPREALILARREAEPAGA